jgi:hypothetical protein
MGKRVIFILALFAVLQLLPLFSALEFNVNANYSSGETMIVKVAANFISPLSKSNIFFYEGHVRIPVQYDVIQAGNSEYYIYASLVNKSAGNYSISIENTEYMSGANRIGGKIVKNFSITNETADFSVVPGAVSSSGDFSIEVQNLKENPISISVDTSEGNSGEREISILLSGNSTKTSFSLQSGEKEKINFRPGIGNKTLRFIEIKNSNVSSGSWFSGLFSSSEQATSYKIPVYLWGTVEGIQQPTFSLEPSSLSYSFATGTAEKKEVYLYNTGSIEIKDILISLDEELVPLVNLSVTKIDKLAPNSKATIGLTFFSKSSVQTLGNIKAKSDDIIAYSSLTLRFISNYTPVIQNETIQSTVKTCTELKGKICNSTTEECSQEPVYAKDSVCCLASCEAIKKSNSGTFTAVIIILVLVAAGAWLYFSKFKKTKKQPVNLLDIARGKD